MDIKKQTTGSDVLNNLLKGGFEKDIITTIYGPAGTGKTCLSILTTVEVAKTGKKTLYIDTEGGFSVDRMKQISPNYQELIKNIMFFKPTSFIEQMEVFEKLKQLPKDNVGLIVVDSIAMLYRLELGSSKNSDVYEVNRQLGRQIGYLTEVARKKQIPVIITNQVYSDFEIKGNVKMVGGDILKYGSKCLIELKQTSDKNTATLKKHRSIPQEKEAEYKIKEEGITPP